MAMRFFFAAAHQRGGRVRICTFVLVNQVSICAFVPGNGNAFFFAAAHERGGRVQFVLVLREELLYHPLPCARLHQRMRPYTSARQHTGEALVSSAARLLQLCCSSVAALLQLIRCENATNTLTNTLRSK